MANEQRSNGATRVSDRLPPQDLEAEQACLGSMLLEAGATSRAMSIIKEEDFYREAHRVIFRAIAEVHNRTDPVDIVTVAAELRRQQKLQAVGGGEYLTALINEVPTSAHIERYARIVAEKSVLRQLIGAGSDIQALAYEDPEDIGSVLDTAEQRIFEIAQRRTSTDFTHIGPAVLETFEKLDQKFNDPGYITGVPTGLVDFDEQTSGLQESDLIIVAGRPSMGKTSLAIANFALNAAVSHDIGVGVFSLEMSKSQLAEMLLCAQARVNSWGLRRGIATQQDWNKIGQALKYLPSAPVYIDDTPGISILELRSKARRLKAQEDIGLIIVDYIQLATVGRYADSRYEEVSAIARALKGLARELELPVVALSQLSRLVERREEKRPILSDLAESGAIEAEADLVCFLYRPSYYERKKQIDESGDASAKEREKRQLQEPGKAEIIIAKHRNGPIGTVEVVFNPKFRVFDNLARRGEDPMPV